MRKLRNALDRPQFGATGEFTDGTISSDDEGAIVFGVSHDPETKLVHINFGTSVTWVAMPPEIAVNLARALLKHAGIGKVELTL